MSIAKGVLYVVATPIGNRGDFSARAIEILQGVDRIAAEDTRHSRPLLQHFGIDRPLIALHEHNEREVAGQLIDALSAGESIALISDAGTPLISDPGFPLVRAAQAAGIRVSPVPGPSAVIGALSVSGLPTDRFVFEGFLPSKSAARRARLDALAGELRTLVFYESTHRIVEMLSALVEAFGADRPATFARELTKTFETVKAGTLGELHAWVEADPDQRKGECVVVVQGAPEVAADQAESERVLAILLTALPVKQAAAIAAQLTGGRKNDLYQLALKVVGGRRVIQEK